MLSPTCPKALSSPRHGASRPYLPLILGSSPAGSNFEAGSRLEAGSKLEDGPRHHDVASFDRLGLSAAPRSAAQAARHGVAPAGGIVPGALTAGARTAGRRHRGSHLGPLDLP